MPTLSVPTLADTAEVRHYLNAGAFDLVPDAGEDGSGTDNRGRLQAFLDELATGRYDEASIPPGRYRISAPVALLSDRLGNLALRADGVELIFTTPLPEKNRAYLTLGTRSQVGGRLLLEGLSTRLSRPAVRTGGSDMIRLRGFSNYHIDGVAIPSADNMGLTIGRGDPKGGAFTPDTILIRNCVIGGRRESQAHSHGSIGDTGIWIVTPAIENDILSCKVRETGDDGIYVGHSSSPLIRRVTVRDNDICDVGARGIGVSVTGGEIVANRIDRTNGGGVTVERQDGADGSGARISNNHLRRIGQLEAGDIGSSMIPKNNPHGVFVHQPGGNIIIDNNNIEETRGGGVHIHSHIDGNFDGLTVSRGVFTRIGIDRQGRPMPSSSGVAVFRKGGSASRQCSGFEAAEIVIQDTPHSLLSWESTGLSDDARIRIFNALLVRCHLNADQPLIRLGARRIGRPTGVIINAKLLDSTIATPLSPPFADQPDHAEVVLTKVR